MFNVPPIPRKAAEEAMEMSYTVDLEPPWNKESPLTKLLVHDGGPNGKNRFHCLDLWHSVHLGVGRSWVASGARMLQKLIPESNVDKRVAAIGRQYMLFCRQNKIDPVLRKIDIHTFGGPGGKERNGSWNKAAVTSNFMLFLEQFCEEHAEKIREDQSLQIFVSYLQIGILHGFTLCICVCCSICA
jgi:hypothetical protein